MIGAPPFDAGVTKATAGEREAEQGEQVTLVGASGAVAGVAAAEGALSDPVPAPVMAATAKV